MKIKRKRKTYKNRAIEKSWRSLRLLNFSFFLFLYICLCLCHSRSLIPSTSIWTIHISVFLSTLSEKSSFLSVISSFSSDSRNELMNYFFLPVAQIFLCIVKIYETILGNYSYYFTFLTFLS